MTEHTTAVKLQRQWNEWRPECTCGWIGSYWKAKATAEREADDHAPVVTDMKETK